MYEGNAEWSRWLEAVSWLQGAAPADAVIMGRKPDLLYLLSGRPTVEYPYTQDTAVLMSALRANGVSYILEDGFTWTRTTETYLAPAMQRPARGLHPRPRDAGPAHAGVARHGLSKRIAGPGKRRGEALYPKSFGYDASPPWYLSRRPLSIAR